MMRTKILAVFPDGVGIRNYLYSDVFDPETTDLILFHNFSGETITYLNRLQRFYNIIKIPAYSESVKEKFLRELISLTRLKHNASITGNPTILQNWKKYHATVPLKLFYGAVTFASSWFPNYSSILKLEKLYQKAIRNTAFYKRIQKILKIERPDVVFCSHQRGLKMATIFAAASDLGIPTTTVIFSWDNLPKARLALRSKKYCVWSDHMKAEMHRYYPEIDHQSVIVTGTPQFDFYKNPKNIIDRATFFRKYGLDDARKIICFSGDDILTSPDDPKYLADMAEAIRNNGLDSEYQILLRRCPADNSGRFDDIVRNYPNLIKEAPPLWIHNKSQGWTGSFPLTDDVALLVSTAYYCDLVVNVGSTMAIDFHMFNKPCIFINYDQPLKKDPEWSVRNIYNFEHFRTMPKDAVAWFNSKDDIAHVVKNAVTLRSEASMSRWSELLLQQPIMSLREVLTQSAMSE